MLPIRYRFGTRRMTPYQPATVSGTQGETLLIRCRFGICWACLWMSDISDQLHDLQDHLTSGMISYLLALILILYVESSR